MNFPFRFRDLYLRHNLSKLNAEEKSSDKFASEAYTIAQSDGRIETKFSSHLSRIVTLIVGKGKNKFVFFKLYFYSSIPNAQKKSDFSGTMKNWAYNVGMK